MPLYEYECEKCGRRTEVRQTVGADGSEVACPSCGTVGLRRVFSAFFCAGADGSALPGGGGGSSCSTCTSGNCASCGL